jgi:hypothetical protein
MVAGRDRAPETQEAGEQVQGGGPADPVERGASEGAAFRASAHASRRGPALVVFAAVAALAVAVLAKGAAPAPPLATVAPQGSLPAIVAPVLPTASPTSVPPPLDPSVTPLPTLVAAAAAAAGVTELVPGFSTPVRVTITLPAGWHRTSAGMYIKPPDPAPAGPDTAVPDTAVPDPGLSIGAWSIEHVYLYPCRWGTQVYADEPSKRTAADLADALAAFWGQDPSGAPFYSNSKLAPIASRPRPATIGGFDATYVEVLVPSDLDFSQCDGGQVILWRPVDGPLRYSLGPFEQNRLWVVDVNGDLVVIDASSPLTPSPADEKELQGVIDSVVIKP